MALRALTLALALASALSACGEREPAPPPPAPLSAAEQARLIGELVAPEVTRRREAVAALAASPALEARSLAALGRLLEVDEDRWVREAAATALRDQGVQAGRQVPQLISALKDEDEVVRWRAAEALGRMGPMAIGALEALGRNAEDPSEVEVVRAASRRAIERIRGPARTPR
jgi:HEAT repeat protein